MTSDKKLRAKQMNGNLNNEKRKVAFNLQLRESSEKFFKVGNKMGAN